VVVPPRKGQPQPPMAAGQQYFLVAEVAAVKVCVLP
jgi:hypothetical protein